MTRLEIACFNAASALHAARWGASRIELCTNQSLGGLTPALSTFLALRNHNTLNPITNAPEPTVKIPIYVMLRPRGGDFVYSREEFEEMERGMEGFMGEGKREGDGEEGKGKGGQKAPDGFVFGILEEDGSVDLVRSGILVSKAKALGKKCTFHRAFDEIPREKMGEALEALIKCGFESVLTSGGGRDVVAGEQVLKELVARARGRIEIIAGGGVRIGNAESLVKETGVRWVHSSAVVVSQGSGTYTGGEGGEVASEEEIGRLVEICGRL